MTDGGGRFPVSPEKTQALLERMARLQLPVPAALSAADLERLTAVFSSLVGKRIVPELVIDDSLIAGVVVEVEGRVFDGSVRSSLQRLGERMAGQSGKPTT